LELAATSEIVAIACRVKPDQATLVPERREEVTTEGGLDVVANRQAVAAAISKMRDAGIYTSLFLDPDPKQLELAKSLGAQAVELHTGSYANAKTGKPQEAELAKLVAAGKQIRKAGLALHAGHGLNYRNVRPIVTIEGMHELNIGHAIVARAVFVGLREAVREMKRLIEL
jgi:pyridoxine 5-phosphate synthase